MKEVNDTDYEGFIGLKDDRTKALKIGATWCGPCKAMDKIMPDIVKRTPTIDWAKVDIDESPELAKRFKIMSVPLVLFFRNGMRESFKIDGNIGMNGIIGLLKSNNLYK